MLHALTLFRSLMAWAVWNMCLLCQRSRGSRTACFSCSESLPDDDSSKRHFQFILFFGSGERQRRRAISRRPHLTSTHSQRLVKAFQRKSWNNCTTISYTQGFDSSVLPYFQNSTLQKLKFSNLMISNCFFDFPNDMAIFRYIQKGILQILEIVSTLNIQNGRLHTIAARSRSLEKILVKWSFCKRWPTSCAWCRPTSDSCVLLWPEKNQTFRIEEKYRKLSTGAR